MTTLLPDESVESLRDALRVVGDVDTHADLFTLFGLGDPADQHGAPSTRSVAAKRTSSKHTNQQLRMEITRLENILVATRTQRDRDCPTKSEENGLRHECRGIVKRQHHQRIAAESENSGLRKALHTQLKLARKSMRLTRQVDTSRANARLWSAASAGAYGGPSIGVAELMAHIATIRANAPSQFTSGGRSPDYREMSYRVSAAGLIKVEFEASWLLPFGVAAVSDAVSQQTSRVKQRGRHCEFQELYADQQALVTRFISTVRPRLGEEVRAMENQLINPMHGVVAVHRETSQADDAVMIVSHFEATVLTPSFSKVLGVIKGNGWVRVEPVDGVSSSRLCRVKWSRHFEGSPPGPDELKPTQRKQWAQQVLMSQAPRHWQQNLGDITQTIENLLLAP